jgi:hypothetical protein
MEGGLEGRPPSIGQLRSTPPIETDGSDGRLTRLDQPAPPDRLARRRQQHREAMRRSRRRERAALAKRAVEDMLERVRQAQSSR